MRRFFTEQPLSPRSEIEFGAELAHRLTRVLRLTAGERIVLVNGAGMEYEAEILETSGRSVRCSILAERPALAEPNVRLSLYQALIKESRFEFVLEKATELGVSIIAPVISARSVVRPDQRSQAKQVRWRRIVIEAAEQCGRAAPPTLAAPATLADSIRQAPGVSILLWEEERALGLSDVLRDTQTLGSEISLFIGPEGGFEPEEAAAARAAGAQVESLGKRVLRSETAAIAAITIVMQAVGELG